MSNTLLYKTYMCLKVLAPSKRQYYAPNNKIPLKKDVVSFGKKHILVCRISHYSSWQTPAWRTYSMPWRNHGIPLNRYAHFQDSNFHCMILSVDRNNILCNHAESVGNTSLRCTKPVKPIYNWNLQQDSQIDPFSLPLVRHHSYKNEQYAIHR